MVQVWRSVLTFTKHLTEMYKNLTEIYKTLTEIFRTVPQENVLTRRHELVVQQLLQYDMLPWEPDVHLKSVS